MSNINKDIHMLKSYAGMTHKLTDNQGRPKLDQAIENVLWALNGKDCIIETQSHNEEVLEEYIAKLEKELKTHKKMTEYFAVKLYDLANEKMKEEYTTTQECYEHAKLRDICVRDMINSARKEVENGNNN